MEKPKVWNSATANEFFLGDAIAHLFFAFLKPKVLQKNSSDSECIQSLKNGNSYAFEILLDRYGDLLFGYCRKLMGNSEKTEDIVQDVWMKVIQNMDRYKEQGQLKAWLFQIARNTCMDELKSKKNWEFAQEEIEEQAISDDFLFEQLEQKALKEQLQKAIDELPDMQRVLLLTYLTEEKSYEELAQEFSHSLSAVKSLLFRAKKNLQQKLGDEDAK